MCTRVPGLVREHRADKANDDIGNSARTKGCVLKTRRIPRTLSALLLVELSIHGFYWIFATLTHAQNKSWCSRTNPGTRVPAPGTNLCPLHRHGLFVDSFYLFLLSLRVVWFVVEGIANKDYASRRGFFVTLLWLICSRTPQHPAAPLFSTHQMATCL